MERLKVMTILGTRPEIIRLSEVIKKCDIYFHHILIHTGQNWDYNLNDIFFKEFGLRQPDYCLTCTGNTLGETLGNIISKSYHIMEKERPDAVLILGDTNSALSAISAKRLKIPIFHLEAGNRCFDENLPEEMNRRIVDHIADINLCYSEQARRNLIMEGGAKDRTFVVGSPMLEVISANMTKINESLILDHLKLEKRQYILLSAHREENIDIETNFYKLMEAVNGLAKRYEIPIIYSVHPRADKYITKRNFEFHPMVKKIKPLSFHDYIKLQLNAFCVISDSGTLPEEASIFRNFSAVSIRTSTERQEALEKGNFILGFIAADQVLQAVEMAVALQNKEDIGTTVADYSDKNVSTKVIKVIQSYTGVVNQMVWRKN